jgi:hypothetical protein
MADRKLNFAVESPLKWFERVVLPPLQPAQLFDYPELGFSFDKIKRTERRAPDSHEEEQRPVSEDVAASITIF